MGAKFHNSIERIYLELNSATAQLEPPFVSPVCVWLLFDYKQLLLLDLTEGSQVRQTYFTKDYPMTTANIRKIITIVEETHTEADKPIRPATRRAAAVAVIENPFAGRYVEDLEALMAVSYTHLTLPTIPLV